MTIDPPSESPNEIPYSEFVALRKRIVAEGFKTLSEDEHADLIRRTKRKEKRASELLILTHERFMFQVSTSNRRKKRKFAPSIDVEETMQEGRIALLRAVETFDPEKGKFTTYLHWWLMHAILRRNSGDPIIRIDPNRFGENATCKADPTNVALVRKIVDIDERVEDPENVTIGETVHSDEDGAETVMIEGEERRRVKEFVRSSMNGLDARDRKIIELRWFGDELRTLEEVGQHFDLSRERIRQIEAEIFDQIRKRIGAFRSKPSSSVCATIPNRKPVPT